MTHRAKTWQVVSTKSLLEHDKITVLEDVVQLPNGKQTKYVYLPSKEDSVIIIALNEQKDLLLQREYSHPPKKIMWQLPGGSIRPGESIITAARRELAEESGYDAKAVTVIGNFYVNNRKSNKVQHIVVCEQLYRHNLKSDPDEFIDSFWLAELKVKQMIANNEIDNINFLAALSIWFTKRELGAL
jgi:ADP-ribose pyrophosphatase